MPTIILMTGTEIGESFYYENTSIKHKNTKNDANLSFLNKIYVKKDYKYEKNADKYCIPVKFAYSNIKNYHSKHLFLYAKLFILKIYELRNFSKTKTRRYQKQKKSSDCRG